MKNLLFIFCLLLISTLVSAQEFSKKPLSNNKPKPQSHVYVIPKGFFIGKPVEVQYSRHRKVESTQPVKTQSLMGSFSETRRPMKRKISN